MKVLSVIAADSAAAILDENFKPLYHGAPGSVIVYPPYREEIFRLAEPIFKEVNTGFEVIVHEAELCRSLLDRIKANVIHLRHVTWQHLNRRIVASGTCKFTIIKNCETKHFKDSAKT